MSRAAVLLALVEAGLAIAAPPKQNDRPWLIARLGNDRFRQKDAVSALTYSPDGKYLASADDETIHIWDAADGRRIRSIPIENHKFFALRYTSDGRTLLAAGMDDRSTRLIKIDPTTGKVRANIAIRAGKTEGTFSADGNWLVLKPVIDPAPFRLLDPRESLVHVVNVATGNDWTAMIEDGLVYSFAFNRDGSAIAVGSNDGRITIFQSHSGRLLAQHQFEDKPIDLTFSSDGKTLLAGLRHQSDNRIASMDVASGKVLWSHAVGGVCRVAFVDDGSKALYFGMDAKSKYPYCWFWLDAATGKPTGEMLDAGTSPALSFSHGIPITTVALNSDGSGMCQGSPDGAISQWDLRARKRLIASCDPHDKVSDLALVEKQTKVRGYSRGWYDWDIKTGKQTRLTRTIHVDLSEDVAISHDSAWLVRFVRKQNIAGREIEFKELSTGKSHYSSTEFEYTGRFRFLPDGRVAMTQALGTTIFDPSTGERKDEYRNCGGILSVTSDSKWIVRVSRDESNVSMTRWNLKTGKIVSDWTGNVAGLGDGQRQVASDTYFSPDGSLVVLQSERLIAPNVTECHSFLVETATGKLRANWSGSRSMGIRFTPDGRSLLEYNLRPFHYYMRETLTGRFRAQVYMPGTSVNEFAFSPDARKLIVSTQPYPIEIWDALGKPSRWEMKPDALWEALAIENSEHAYKSIRHLLLHPAKATPFLKERMKVPEPPPAEWVKDRLKALDAAQFRDREKATADLAAAGELLLPALREAQKTASEEAQSRLKPLIEKAIAMTPEKMRAIRACEVLEGLGTPEALSLLEAWARGAPAATLTREATESAARIKSSR